MINSWSKDLKKAPKNAKGEVNGPSILGWDGYEQAVMFYTIAYPLDEGGWVTGFTPTNGACWLTDYIDTPQRFRPTHWKYLDKPPQEDT